MENAVFGCPAEWAAWLPPDVGRVEDPRQLEEREWQLLALTRAGCSRLEGNAVRCRTLLVPGDCDAALLSGIQADCVITCGLSPRDSLTLSSLETPVLCVQRALPGPGGTVIEPQEIPLSPLPGPAEVFLPILGIRLLRMPQTQALFCDTLPL